MISIKHSPSLCKDVISKLNTCVIWDFDAMLNYTGVKRERGVPVKHLGFDTMLNYIGVKLKL